MKTIYVRYVRGKQSNRMRSLPLSIARHSPTDTLFPLLRNKRFPSLIIFENETSLDYRANIRSDIFESRVYILTIAFSNRYLNAPISTYSSNSIEFFHVKIFILFPYLVLSSSDLSFIISLF